MDFSDPLFWTALAKIIGVNIVLSGDNAVVIALAARSLPPKQQKLAIFWGSGAAIIMRIVLTLFAVALLDINWLKIVGSALLLWIGVKLLAGDDEEGEDKIKGHDSMIAAVRTILIADLVMSLDNVIAVAAAAKGSTLLLILGLAISIPLIIYASTLLIKLMERFPVIITIGAALIGWVAGEMAWEDKAIASFTGQFPQWTEYIVAALCAVLVVVAGRQMAKAAESSTASQSNAS